jgi:uncharacterized phiE125 gp8 family phage protein
MNYNAVISVEDITDESGVYEEPVSLDEMKDYLRLEGFIDLDESTTDDLSNFDFDDLLITELITAARGLFEETAGISMRRKTLEAVITNLCGMIEIPYGPIVSITSLIDYEGNEITSDNYRTVGNTWKKLVYPCNKHMAITYEAGYVDLPKAMKIDLMRLVSYMYEHRGDDSAIQSFSSQLISKYSRNAWIV